MFESACIVWFRILIFPFFSPKCSRFNSSGNFHFFVFPKEELMQKFKFARWYRKSFSFRISIFKLHSKLCFRFQISLFLIVPKKYFLFEKQIWQGTPGMWYRVKLDFLTKSWHCGFRKGLIDCYIWRKLVTSAKNIGGKFQLITGCSRCKKLKKQRHDWRKSGHAVFLVVQFLPPPTKIPD